MFPRFILPPLLSLDGFDQTDRKRNGQTDRGTGRQTEGQADRQTEGQAVTDTVTSVEEKKLRSIGSKPDVRRLLHMVRFSNPHRFGKRREKQMSERTDAFRNRETRETGAVATC